MPLALSPYPYTKAVGKEYAETGVTVNALGVLMLHILLCFVVTAHFPLVRCYYPLSILSWHVTTAHPLLAMLLLLILPWTVAHSP